MRQGIYKIENFWVSLGTNDHVSKFHAIGYIYWRVLCDMVKDLEKLSAHPVASLVKIPPPMYLHVGPCAIPVHGTEIHHFIFTFAVAIPTRADFVIQ